VATSPRIAFRAVRSLSGLAIPSENFAEAASQTFKQGAPVYLLVGYLNICGTDPVLIMGIASRDGQNNGSAGVVNQLVFLAHPDTLFVGNVDNNAGGSGTTSVLDRGRNFGITIHSGSGKWTVDSNKLASNKRVIVWTHLLADGEVVGDTLGRVIFSFDPQYFQGHKTS